MRTKIPWLSEMEMEIETYLYVGEVRLFGVDALCVLHYVVKKGRGPLRYFDNVDITLI